MKKIADFNDLPLALTVTEAAEALRIGRNTAYNPVRSERKPSSAMDRLIHIGRPG